MTFRQSRIKTVLFSAAVLLLTVTVAFASGIILGDADGDRTVTIIDATLVQRKLADIPVSADFSEKAADVNGSGDIDITDATFIQRWLAEIRTPYDIGLEIAEPTEAPTEPPTEPPTQWPTDDEGWGHIIIRP